MPAATVPSGATATASRVGVGGLDVFHRQVRETEGQVVVRRTTHREQCPSVGRERQVTDVGDAAGLFCVVRTTGVPDVTSYTVTVPAVEC
ncbi:hypothetical protein [Streptomyces sp. NPDC001139]